MLRHAQAGRPSRRSSSLVCLAIVLAMLMVFTPAARADLVQPQDEKGRGWFLALELSYVVTDKDDLSGNEVSSGVVRNDVMVRDGESFLVAPFRSCADGEVEGVGEVNGRVTGDLIEFSGLVEMRVHHLGTCGRNFDKKTVPVSRSLKFAEDHIGGLVRVENGDGAVDVSVVVVRAEPIDLPSSEMAMVEVSATLMARDDDDPDEFAPASMWSRVALVADGREREMLSAILCAGDEVRAEYTVSVVQHVGSKMELIERVELFEGTTCENDDLDGEGEFKEIVSTTETPFEFLVMNEKEEVLHDRLSGEGTSISYVLSGAAVEEPRLDTRSDIELEGVISTP